MQTAPVGQKSQNRRSAGDISPARRAAFEILRRVEAEKSYASVLLSSLGSGLRVEDRALCHELVLGVLRWQLWLDRLIEHFAARNVESLDLPARLALQIGLYQLRFLSRVPPSAAVNESVNLVRTGGARSAAGFVNAVLRRSTREPDYNPAEVLSDPLERIAVETSHPRWLIERWARLFGAREAESLARANNQPAPEAFRLTGKNPEGSSRQAGLEQLRAAGAEVTPSRIAAGAWRVRGAAELVRQLAQQGLIYPQDEASQLVARALGAQPGDRILDVCAAPGSKTTHVATLEPRAAIVGGDLREHRLRTLRKLAWVQGHGGIHLVAYDATQPLPFADASFERVLVDAPCTGTGTLRRNPEIKGRISAQDIVELSAKQGLILRNASRKVTRGGRLVYSTCSIEPEENEAILERFLSENSGFQAVRAEVDEKLQTSTGAVRTWPHRHDVDGFFIAVFRRIA